MSRDDRDPNPHFPPTNPDERRNLELLNIRPGERLAPQTLGQAMEWARVLCDSELVPKSYRGKPADVLVCILWGGNLGLDAVQSLQNVMIANGKASVYGDAVLGIVRAKCAPGEFRQFKETWDPDLNGGTWTTTVQRGNEEPVVRSFSMAEALRIKVQQLDWSGVAPGGRPRTTTIVLGEKETYQNYPRRMCKFKARNEALRDVFPDYLLGIVSREDADEYIEASSWSVDGEPRGAAVEPLETEADLYAVMPANLADRIRQGFDLLRWGKAQRLVKLREYRERAEELANFLRDEYALINTAGARRARPLTAAALPPAAPAERFQAATERAEVVRAVSPPAEREAPAPVEREAPAPVVTEAPPATNGSARRSGVMF